MAKLARIYSSPEKVAYTKRKMEKCLCRMENRRGIVLKVFAARFYDGIRALVAWDSMTGGDPVFRYHDVLEINVY